MPRLAPFLLRKARTNHVLLPLLLRECRDLLSARNELRWLKEHAYESNGLPAELATPPPPGLESSMSRAVWQTLVRNVQRRSTGEPLQYIIGTQPFGDLEILCRQDVLIPRPETEAYTRRLASLLKSQQQKTGFGVDGLRILDLCSGTGCISILLHSLLKPARSGGTRKVEIIGIDISEDALALANDNIQHNIGENLLHLSAVTDVSFKRGSVFDLCDELKDQGQDGLQQSIFGSNIRFDVLVANPPYISPRDYGLGGTTARSVREYEPKLALVPDLSNGAQDGDAFYRPLLDIALKVKASFVVLETGDHSQALRVRLMAIKMYRSDDRSAYVELWDDHGDVVELGNEGGQRARSVVSWTRDAERLWKIEREQR